MSIEAEESIVRIDYLATGGEDIEDFKNAALQWFVWCVDPLNCYSYL